MGWDKNHLKGKWKAGHASKIRNSCTNSHQQVSIQEKCLGKQGSTEGDNVWVEKYHCSKSPNALPPTPPYPPPSFFFPQIYILSMTSYGLECQMGQLPQLFPLITSCADSMEGWDEEQKRLWDYISSAQK